MCCLLPARMIYATYYQYQNPPLIPVGRSCLDMEQFSTTRVEKALVLWHCSLDPEIVPIVTVIGWCLVCKINILIDTLKKS